MGPDGQLEITCPKCGRTSYNPMDIAEGYCGNCHDWTSARKHLHMILHDSKEFGKGVFIREESENDQARS